MRPARLERATFWFVAGKRHFSATSSFSLSYSNKSTYGVLSCLELSGNNPIFQFSASVSASVKTMSQCVLEEEHETPKRLCLSRRQFLGRARGFHRRIRETEGRQALLRN